MGPWTLGWYGDTDLPVPLPWPSPPWMMFNCSQQWTEKVPTAGIAGVGRSGMRAWVRKGRGSVEGRGARDTACDWTDVYCDSPSRRYV